MNNEEKPRNYFPTPNLITLVPNGDVFICATTNKLSRIGNIKNETINSMIEKLSGTILSKIIEGSNCSYLSNFLSPIDNKCDICKNLPLDEDFNFYTEINGRKFISINEKIDFEKLFNQVRNTNRDLLVSVNLKEPKIKNNYTKNLENFLNKLSKEKINFILSRPLPPCIKLNVILDKYTKPDNCFECRELFTVKNYFVRICPLIHNLKGKEFKETQNRKEVYEELKNSSKNIKLNSKCKTCIYLLRSQCNGLCFGKKNDN